MNRKTVKIISKAFACALILALALLLFSCGGGSDVGGNGDNNGGNNGGGSDNVGYPSVTLKDYNLRFITEESYADGTFYDESLARISYSRPPSAVMPQPSFSVP